MNVKKIYSVIVALVLIVSMSFACFGAENDFVAKSYDLDIYSSRVRLPDGTSSSIILSDVPVSFTNPLGFDFTKTGTFVFTGANVNGAQSTLTNIYRGFNHPNNIIDISDSRFQYVVITVQFCIQISRGFGIDSASLDVWYDANSKTVLTTNDVTGSFQFTDVNNPNISYIAYYSSFVFTIDDFISVLQNSYYLSMTVQVGTDGSVGRNPPIPCYFTPMKVDFYTNSNDLLFGVSSQLDDIIDNQDEINDKLDDILSFLDIDNSSVEDFESKQNEFDESVNNMVSADESVFQGVESGLNYDYSIDSSLFSGAWGDDEDFSSLLSFLWNNPFCIIAIPVMFGLAGYYIVVFRG